MLPVLIPGTPNPRQHLPFMVKWEGPCAYFEKESDAVSFAGSRAVAEVWGRKDGGWCRLKATGFNGPLPT